MFQKVCVQYFDIKGGYKGGGVIGAMPSPFTKK